MYPLSTMLLLSGHRRVQFWVMAGNLLGLLQGTWLWHLPSLLMELPDSGSWTGSRLLRDAQGSKVQRFS